MQPIEARTVTWTVLLLAACGTDPTGSTRQIRPKGSPRLGKEVSDIAKVG
jgi:hypothetical protein